MEWDERSPVWGIGLVKSGPKPGKRKEIGVVQDRFANTAQAPAPSTGGGSSTGIRRDRGTSSGSGSRERSSTENSNGGERSGSSSRMTPPPITTSPGIPYAY